MSKGIMNRRDKMIWDNSALPTIDDVTGQISDLAESVAEDLQDAYEELDDKIDQAVTDCTYTAGTGISIDEDNVISAIGGGGGVDITTTEALAGFKYNGKDVYVKEVVFNNVAQNNSYTANFDAVDIVKFDGYAVDASSGQWFYNIINYGPGYNRAFDPAKVSVSGPYGLSNSIVHLFVYYTKLA